MASLQDIKGRIKSINSTKQITNAMKLVSTAKLTKSKQAVFQTRPFFDKVQMTIASIAKQAEGTNCPLFKSNGVTKKAVIVMASDRGLAGGYNANVVKLAMKEIENPSDVHVVAVGKKAKEGLKVRGVDVQKELIGITADPAYSDAKEIAHYVIELYEKGEIGEVYVAYTRFKSTIQQEPTLIRLLPVDIEEVERGSLENNEPQDLLLYEPSQEEVLKYLVPHYVASVLYGAMVESSASEQGARMTAMDSATNNADEMIEKLEIVSNRARQAAITQELSEIVGGAEALK
ncbi:MAG: ATP synthase F1 subunit gamma [Cellulosilyticaceae bacterium]